MLKGIKNVSKYLMRKDYIICTILLFIAVLSILFFRFFYSRCNIELFSDYSPIDIVYTWVDGNDPEWLLKKKQY